MRVGQYIFSIPWRLLFKNTSSFFSSIRQVSHAYNSTESTLDLKILILVLLLNWLLFQILPSLLYPARAFPGLARMSSSVPPDLLMYVPKYARYCTCKCNIVSEIQVIQLGPQFLSDTSVNILYCSPHDPVDLRQEMTRTPTCCSPASRRTSHRINQLDLRHQLARGGTLGISRWGWAAGTLEPLAYTRAISVEFC